MLYIKSFSNYTEFQEIFGVRVFGEEKARKNKILLALLKDKSVHKRAIETGDYTLLSIRNMVDLKTSASRSSMKAEPRAVNFATRSTYWA